MIMNEQIKHQDDIDPKTNNNSKWGILASKNINLLVGIHDNNYPDEDILKQQNQYISKQSNFIRPEKHNKIFKSAFNVVSLHDYDFFQNKMGKQVLFASTKNKKQKKNFMNFQITKSNQTEDDSKKDYYCHLLLSSVDSLIEKGIISVDEIYKDPVVSEDFYKCENKSCTFISHKKFNLIKVKNFKSKPIWLCYECCKAYNNEQFCYYCGTIYRDNYNDSYNDNKSWIQCDFCELWHHIQCEEIKGCYTNISKLINDQNFKYMCLICRNKNKRKAVGKNKLSGLKRNRVDEKESLIKKSSESELNPQNDSRDIYHDFYKIIHINHNKD